MNAHLSDELLHMFLSILATSQSTESHTTTCRVWLSLFFKEFGRRRGPMRKVSSYKPQNTTFFCVIRCGKYIRVDPSSRIWCDICLRNYSPLTKSEYENWSNYRQKQDSLFTIWASTKMYVRVCSFLHPLLWIPPYYDCRYNSAEICLGLVAGTIFNEIWLSRYTLLNVI